MSRRARKHRKHFGCGHKGFGQYCHRCADRARQNRLRQDAIRERKAQRQSWQATFEQDDIDLQRLPRGVILKAREIMRSLEAGVAYWQLSGRRLQSARWIIRIPVTRRYRLLCVERGDHVWPLRLVSHEDYNLLVRGVHRWANQTRRQS